MLISRHFRHKRSTQSVTKLYHWLRTIMAGEARFARRFARHARGLADRPPEGRRFALQNRPVRISCFFKVYKNGHRARRHPIFVPMYANFDKISQLLSWERCPLHFESGCYTLIDTATYLKPNRHINVPGRHHGWMANKTKRKQDGKRTRPKYDTLCFGRVFTFWWKNGRNHPKALVSRHFRYKRSTQPVTKLYHWLRTIMELHGSFDTLTPMELLWGSFSIFRVKMGVKFSKMTILGVTFWKRMDSVQ